MTTTLTDVQSDSDQDDRNSQFQHLATTYSDHGFRVLEVSPDTKRPVGKNWQDRASSDADQIVRWIEGGSSIGLKLGPDSGVIDVEHDSDEGKAILEWCFSDPVEPITTPAYRSAKSVHYLFRFNPSLLPDVTKVQHQGVEVRIGATGRALQSVLPPSRHPSGVHYEWLPGRAPAETDFQNIPMRLFTWIQEAIRAGTRDRTQRDENGDLFVPHGERHDYLKSKAVELRKKGFSRIQMQDLLRAYDQTLIHLDWHNADSQINDLIDWSHSNITPEEADSSAPRDSLEDEDIFFADAAIQTPEEKEAPIITPFIRRGEVINLVGSTKTGKTWFALAMSMAVATGTKFLG